MPRRLKIAGDWVDIDGAAGGGDDASIVTVLTGRTSLTSVAPNWITGTMPSAHGGAHVKGAWTEILSAAPDDADEITLLYYSIGASGLAASCLVDIGVGPNSGAVTVRVPDMILAHGGTSSVIPAAVTVRGRIDSGEKVWARWQTARTTGLAPSWALGLGKRTSGRSATPVNLGADHATSLGVQMATKDTWYPVETSTADAYTGFFVLPGASAAAMGASLVAFDIGIGPSGSEVVHSCKEIWRTSAQEEMIVTLGRSLYVPIPGGCPAGSRVAIRYSNNGAGSTLYNAVLLAVPA